MKTQHFSIDLTQRPPRELSRSFGQLRGFGTHAREGPGDPRREEWRIYLQFSNRPAPGAIGFDSDALLKELPTGKGDGEILEWVQAHSKTPRSAWEIEAWSAFMDKRAPDTDAETLASFAEHLDRLSKTREDVKTFFEFGELDDYVSFGGKV